MLKYLRFSNIGLKYIAFDFVLCEQGLTLRGLENWGVMNLYYYTDAIKVNTFQGRTQVILLFIDSKINSMLSEDLVIRRITFSFV